MIPLLLACARPAPQATRPVGPERAEAVCTDDGWCWDEPRPWGADLKWIAMDGPHDVAALGPSGRMTRLQKGQWTASTLPYDEVVGLIRWEDGYWTLTPDGLVNIDTHETRPSATGSLLMLDGQGSPLVLDADKAVWMPTGLWAVKGRTVVHQGGGWDMPEKVFAIVDEGGDTPVVYMLNHRATFGEDGPVIEEKKNGLDRPIVIDGQRLERSLLVIDVAWADGRILGAGDSGVLEYRDGLWVGAGPWLAANPQYCRVVRGEVWAWSNTQVMVHRGGRWRMVLEHPTGTGPTKDLPEAQWVGQLLGAPAPAKGWRDFHVFDDGTGWVSGRELAHWDGFAWTPHEAPTTFGLFAADPDHVWTVTGSQVLFWDGQRWQDQPLPEGTRSLARMDGSGPDNVIAYGRKGMLVHWDGTRWTRLQTDTTDEFVGSHVYSDQLAIVLTSRGVGMRWDGQTWTRFQAPTDGTHDVYIESPDQIHMLDWDGRLFTQTPDGVQSSSTGWDSGRQFCGGNAHPLFVIGDGLRRLE